MCRLLGIYGQVDGWREIVSAFSYQAETGNIPPVENLKPGHKDGWGMTISNEQCSAMVPYVRQLGSAYQSPGFQQALESLGDQPDILFCHLRKASPTIPITLPNAHPFTHNGWALIHNGTVFQADTLPRDPDLVLTSDDSDSECLFQYLLTRIRDREAGQSETTAIQNAVSSMTVDFNSINFVLSNGRDFFALRCFRQYETHFTLYYYHTPSGFVVCSEPIDYDGFDQARWTLLANNSLVKIYGSPPQIDVMSVSKIL